MSNDEEDHYTLSMPFVVVESEGGVYEDKAYAAGFETGRFWVLLEILKPVFWEGIVRTPNLDQLDLICMKFGYVVEHNQDHPNEFTFLRIRKVDDGIMGGS